MTLDQCLAHYGSHAEIARALGIKAPSIYGWTRGVPPLRQIQLEHVSGGALKADAGIIPACAPQVQAAA